MSLKSGLILFTIFFLCFEILAQSPLFMRVHQADELESQSIHEIEVYGSSEGEINKDKFLTERYFYKNGKLKEQLVYNTFQSDNCTENKNKFSFYYKQDHDKKGDMIVNKSYNDFDKKETEKHFSYKYNEDGKISMKSIKNLSDGTEYTEYYSYSESGNLLRFQTYNIFMNAPMNITYEYDKLDRLVKINYPTFYYQFEYLPNGEITKYQYEENTGKLFSERKYDAESRELYEKSLIDKNIVVYRYNTQGQLIEEEEFVLENPKNYTGKTSYKINFTYDKNGLMNKQKVVKGNNTFYYEYILN